MSRIGRFQSSEHEEIKEWVLATSVDDAAQRELLLDKRGVFEASLIDGGRTYEPCIITGRVAVTERQRWPQDSGYPVVNSSVRVGDLVADREELNRFLIIVKTSQSDQLLDAQDFISKWAKSPLAMALWLTCLEGQGKANKFVDKRIEQNKRTWSKDRCQIMLRRYRVCMSHRVRWTLFCLARVIFTERQRLTET